MARFDFSKEDWEAWREGIRRKGVSRCGRLGQQDESDQMIRERNRWYDLHRWTKRSQQQLREHPLCVKCLHRGNGDCG